MCKSFSNKELLWILGFTLGFSLTAISQQSLYTPRSLDLFTSLDEGLYHHVLAELDPYEDMISAQDIDRNRVISLLHTRYPQLTYELERTPKQTISGGEISKLLVEILKDETSTGVSDVDGGFWGIVESADLERKEQITFKFLYAYELFKQKRFTEADKIFDQILKERKGEYEYAFYYSGLIALLDKNYEEAHAKLKKIGADLKLRQHTPYYLAAAHYGKKNYNDIVRFYEPRINDRDLHNINGITKIVAYAQYKTNDFAGAISSLTKLSDLRTLTDEENYVLGIAYQKSGNEKASSGYLNEVAQVEGDLSSKASYEYALNLAEQGQDKLALTKFEELLKQGDFDKNEITWNLAVLNGRIKNYDKLAFHALTLIESPKRNQALKLLNQVLDNLDNDKLYKEIVVQLDDKLEDKALIKSSIYNKAVAALQSNQKGKAEEYFDLLSDIDPLIEERGSVAAWRGIMAYEDANYTKAIRLLTNYQSSQSDQRQANRLDFDVSYFLGYSNYRLKNHSAALGHFGQALEQLQGNNGIFQLNDIDSKKEDIFLRLGDSYFLLDDYKSAARSYSKIVDNNGSLKDYALWQNATIAELENRPFDQILILDEIISDYATGKYYDRARFSTANTLFAINKYDKAANYYKQVISSDAPLAMQEESIIQLGLINVNAGTYDQAEKYFKRLVDNSENQEMILRSHLALKEIYANYTYDTNAYLDLVSTSTDQNEEKDVVKALYELAQQNYEKGQLNKASEQWSRLLKEYPDHQLAIGSSYNLGSIYESNQDWIKAYDAYYHVTTSTDNGYKERAFRKAELVAFDHLSDYNKYIKIRTEHNKAFPKSASKHQDIYKESLAYLNIGNIDQSVSLANQYWNTKDATSSKNKTLVTAISSQLIKTRKWSQLTNIYKMKRVESIVNKEPKLIYQRSLGYFNDGQLDIATTSITDHYDTLLGAPAWLAKGIILISDIYVLQDDTDSATAALEALITSKGNIPSSLIKTAKDRLKALELQN